MLLLILLVYLGWFMLSLDGFARERLVGRNTNVMGYPFLDGT